MIYLKLKIDNFYMFKDSEFDFTYPKKIINSTIENEFLEGFPKINYKKVCILMGANASGKTSLGKLMCSINNYLYGRNIERVPKIIFDKNKNASIEVIYITPKTKEIHKLTTVFNIENLVEEIHQVQKLKKTYNLEKTLEYLDQSPKFIYNKNNHHDIKNPGFRSVAYSLGHTLDASVPIWNYTYSDFSSSTELQEVADTSLLEKILQSFDSSILSVKKIQESNNNTYLIKFPNDGEVILKDGKISNPNRLSRGTIESIDIAQFINFLISEKTGRTLFCDEKMAYSHSEMETTLLNLMIEKLKPNSQLFYTTHNYDILEMNLPTHSYTFMRKENFVTVSHPEKMGYTKNDRNLLGYVKNDVFNTLPDTSKIERLL